MDAKINEDEVCILNIRFICTKMKCNIRNQLNKNYCCNECKSNYLHSVNKFIYTILGLANNSIKF